MPPKKATTQSKSNRTVTKPPEIAKPSGKKSRSKAKPGTHNCESNAPSGDNQQQPRETTGPKKTRASHKLGNEELLCETDLEAFLTAERARKAASNRAKRLAAQEERRRQTQLPDETANNTQILERYLTEQALAGTLQPELDPLLADLRLDAYNLMQSIDRVANRTADINDPAAIAASIVNKINTFTREPFNRTENMVDESIATKTSKKSGLSDAQKVHRCIKSNVARLANEDYLQNSHDNQIVSEINNDPSSLGEEDSWKWGLDMAKCRRSNEAVFQRTIMMRTINRFGFEAFATTVDWTTESVWKSPAPEVSKNERQLWNPKPDLAVGFQPKILFPDNPSRIDKIPTVLRPHILPDASDTTSDDAGRVFPFLMLEVKGQTSTNSGKGASLQSVNDAAHALFNIWQFMKEEESMRETFFEKVRVFTAGGHDKQFWVRVHRAEHASDTPSEECPLRFEFHDIVRLEGSSYTQHRVQTIIGNIITWCRSNLLPLARQAAEHACVHAESISDRSLKGSIAELRKGDSQIYTSEQTPDESQFSPSTTLGKRPGDQADAGRVEKNARTNTGEQNVEAPQQGKKKRGRRSKSDQQQMGASFGSGTNEATNQLASVGVADSQ